MGGRGVNATTCETFRNYPEPSVGRKSHSSRLEGLELGPVAEDISNNKRERGGVEFTR